MKTIWITGGGSGIGKCLAIRLAEKGHKVFISGRDLDKLKSVGHGTFPLVCDITDEQQVIETLNKIGPLDIAFLNAGAYEPNAVLDTSLDDFRKTMEVNYFGALNCIHAALEVMKRQNSGHLLVTGSVAGYRGLPRASGYGPSKAALISLCESLNTELLDSPIKLQLVNPGFVRTPLTDKNDFNMPDMIEPEQAAEEILKGMQSDRFEIAFPKKFVFQLKLLRILPYKLFFPLIAKVTKS